ncbi:MAG TPA: tetratricopeptide repeat protein [Gemmatimonadales bacterium]|jgi:tetratricopeptide (TPR) repeat protein
MNFEKLKETARKFEQKEEWRRAIDVYQQAIREFEAGHDPAPDLAIYNRVGDLYLKANEPGAAVQAYEKAAELYKEQGFYNNAIALCGKILRVNPGRIQTYLTLAHLHARKNVVIEAKKNLLEYLERMNALGQLDQAFKAVKDFADQFPSNKEIRLMLSELLRASDRFEEAREQLEKLASDLEARGDTLGARKTLARLHALDAEESDTTPKAPSRPKPGELVFLDTGADAAGSPRRPSIGRKSPARGVESTTRIVERTPSLPKMDMPDEAAAEEQQIGIETSSLSDVPLTLESVQPISDEAQMEMTHLEVAQTLGFEATIAEESATDQVKPLDGLEIDAPLPDTVDLELTPDLGIERNLDVEDEVENITSSELNLIAPEGLEETPDLTDDLALDLEELPTAEESAGDEGLGLDLIDPDAPLTSIPTEDLPLADLGAEEPAGMDETGSEVDFLEIPETRQLTVAELEDQVLEDPDNPDTHRALGEALLAAGESPRGQEELELALSAYENREDWDHASDLVNELIRLDPSGVRYHQKRVELAFRGGDRTRLLDAYVELGDALMRVGALDKAVAVYRRVVEHDPDNGRAQAALDSLAPPEEAPPVHGREAEEPEGEIEIQEATEDELAEAEEPEERRGPRLSKPMFAPSSDFVDLGSMVLEDDRPRDLRMRVEDEEPTGDEQKDFQEMLTQFKRGVDENIGAEDFQAHYDLGVAFREMGLLDEAIAEFQKALRAPEGRLRTSEALGTSFFDKKQFPIAEAILRRAVESLGASDEEQIGLLYWLGRAREEQGKVDTALPCYERVLAVDIGFQDVGSRIARLAGSR